MRTRNLATLSVLLALILNFAAVAGRAAEETSDKSAIESYERSRICPPGPRREILTFKEFCPSECARQRSCSNNPEADPCIADVSSLACKQKVVDVNACLDRLYANHALAYQYNSILDKCTQADRQNDPMKDRIEAAGQKAAVAQSKQAEYNVQLEKVAKQQAAKIADDQRRVQDNLRKQREQLAADRVRQREAEESAAQEDVQAEPDPPQRSANRTTNGKVCFAGYQDCLHDCMRTTGNEGSAGFCGMCSTQNGENCYRRQ
jgi:hypothetical protein